MQRFAAPLKECFSINHFWYYRIIDSGLYSYMGTHTAWAVIKEKLACRSKIELIQKARDIASIGYFVN
jgi:hypothetical protein